MLRFVHKLMLKDHEALSVPFLNCLKSATDIGQVSRSSDIIKTLFYFIFNLNKINNNNNNNNDKMIIK